MWTVQATRSTMCPMTDQLTAGPGSGDDAIHEVSALFVVSRRRARALVFGKFRGRGVWGYPSSGLTCQTGVETAIAAQRSFLGLCPPEFLRLKALEALSNFPAE